jgi:hypothetical protein
MRKDVTKEEKNMKGEGKTKKEPRANERSKQQTKTLTKRQE